LQCRNDADLRFNINLNLLPGDPIVQVGEERESRLAISLKSRSTQNGSRLNFTVGTTLSLGNRRSLIQLQKPTILYRQEASSEGQGISLDAEFSRSVNLL
jgi:hypothetical protein